LSAVVLTAGETMALFDPDHRGPPRCGGRFTLRVAGAESNVAIGLARLGVEARWLSRLGQDELGAAVRAALEAEGVDLRWAVWDAQAPTGLFLKSRSDGRSSVVYYRSGSAASRLGPADVPDEALEGVDLVHLTGITLALSAGCRELVLDLARRAHEHGAQVQFDPNYREALWQGPQAALEAEQPLHGLIDWYLCGSAEASLLFGADDDRDSLDAMADAGIERAVVRAGRRGSLVMTSGGVAEVNPPGAEEADVLDEIGAGDAFAAGFAFGLLRGWPPERCTHAGHTIAAYALRGTGDWETLPRLDEVAEALEGARGRGAS
jgi:sugar/nucleoside kinase (ribokinase family)